MPPLMLSSQQFTTVHISLYSLQNSPLSCTVETTFHLTRHRAEQQTYRLQNEHSKWCQHQSQQHQHLHHQRSEQTSTKPWINDELTMLWTNTEHDTQRDITPSHFSIIIMRSFVSHNFKSLRCAHDQWRQWLTWKWGSRKAGWSNWVKNKGQKHWASRVRKYFPNKMAVIC